MMKEQSSSWGTKMGTFSYTKLKKLSFGNRIAYTYRLANVQTTGSILRTPFKKITGYLIQNTTLATSSITVTANTEKSASNNEATLTFASDAEASADILVVGLL